MARKKRRNANKMYKAVAGALTVILAVVLILAAPEKNDNTEKISGNDYLNSPMCVTFFDVGQGDASLISCDGYNVLIDGGESENSTAILSFLRKNGIDKLDGYVLTHPHSDHIGASAAIIENIECDKVLTTYFSEFNVPTTNVYERVLDAIYNSGAEPVAVEAGDSFTFGNLQIDVVAPIYESEDYNAMSVVFTAEYKNSTVLFTGDTIKSVEDQILDYGFDVDADVIKIAHHGSSSSSSIDFIEAVSPEMAIISCGYNNSYGHPHNETIQLLNDYGIEYYQTDESGNIYYFGDGYNMKVVTDK